MNTNTLIEYRRIKRFGIALISVAVIVSLAITTPATAEEPAPLQIPGYVDGVGIHFEVTGSEFLNILLDSSEIVNLSLYSFPEIVQMTVESASEVISTQITIRGFSPSTTYYKYEAGNINPVEFTTDANGSYSYIQDISEQKLIWFQTETSTKYIWNSPTGGECYLIGNWDLSTRTCTLTTDLNETLWVINNDIGITIDGNGHRISVPGERAIFVEGRGHSDVTLKNLIVSGSSTGIMLYATRNSKIIDSIITENWIGIDVEAGYQETISDCVISGSGYGIWLGYYTSYHTIRRNSFTNNTIGFVFARGNNFNSIYNNNFIQISQLIWFMGGAGNIYNMPAPEGGNYYSSYDEPSEGCSDLNEDGFCDSPYVISAYSNTDYLPWTKQDGWVNQPPTADAGGPYEAYEGDAINLDASGSSDPNDNITLFEWDLNNDGEYDDATGVAATVAFDESGTYTVGLKVTDDFSKSDTDIATINVLDQVPTAEFTWSPKPQNEGLPVQFTDQSASEPDEIIQWSWDFAGLGSSTEQNPSFTFMDNGVYEVCLTVTDDDGSTATVCYEVTILDLAPTADFTWSPKPQNEGSPVQFDNKSTSNPDLIVSRAWNFAGLGTSTDQNPSFTFTDNGQYNVCLTVTDDDNSTVTTCHDVTINNVAPTLTLSGASSIDEGSIYSLNLSTVTDPGADVISDCTLKWGDGLSDDCMSAIASTITHTYADGLNNYTISVDLDDEDGIYENVNSLPLTLNNVSPTITSITAPLVPVNINSQPTSIEVAFTDPGLNDTHNVVLDWGDGQTDTLNGVNSPALGSHTYSEAGVYTVMVTVSDDDGTTDNEIYEFVVIYDPTGGFVTGGGWIWSPAGAYVADPILEGKATFGFVSKYLKGANVPSGNTEFQFKTGNLNFKSTNYQWLIVNKSGNNAQFKGYGTINGVGNYGFMLWATDGSPDTFRIMIWVADDETIVVYDNGASQPIGGGSIVVHTR